MIPLRRGRPGQSFRKPFCSRGLCRSFATATVAALWGGIQVHASETNAPAATPVIRTPPMTVTAPEAPPALQSTAVLQPADMLRASPDVLMNSQGGAGGQTDLSIQGSSFSGAGLSLGGFSLRNPQTEHFNAELPLPAELLSLPRTLTGLAQARETDGHLAGTVAFGLRPIESTRSRLDVGAGQDGLSRQSAFVERPIGHGPREDGERLGVSLFAHRDIRDAVDFETNDREDVGGGGRLHRRTDDTTTDLVFGARRKRFGATGYYGVSPQLPAEEELKDWLVLLESKRYTDAGHAVRGSAIWRRLEDTYTLDLEGPGDYRNHHVSTLGGLNADGLWRPAGRERLRVTWRALAEAEDLDSVSLGHHRRERLALQAIPEIDRGRWTVSAGLRQELFSNDSPALLPQAGIVCRALPGLRLEAACTETVRQPSYTELHYDSPGSLGDAGLERSRARALQATLRWQPTGRLDLGLGAFFRHENNVVDWIRRDADATRWTAANLGTVKTRGLNLSARVAAAPTLDLAVVQSWLDKTSGTDPFASRYVLDYPESLTRLILAWRPVPQATLRISQTLRRQTENPARTGGRRGSDAYLDVVLSPPRHEWIRLTLSIENPWQSDFQPLPGVPAIPRRVAGTLSFAW